MADLPEKLEQHIICSYTLGCSSLESLIENSLGFITYTIRHFTQEKCYVQISLDVINTMVYGIDGLI